MGRSRYGRRPARGLEILLIEAAASDQRIWPLPMGFVNTLAKPDWTNMKNKFCSLSDLKNEASVETWFVDPLLKFLGFVSDDIHLKTSLKELKVGKGNKAALYKPDYVVLSKSVPTLVVDAKGPSISVESYEHQCASYCLEMNKVYDYNPVDLFVLTNGLELILKKWDSNKPILIMKFDDFVDGNAKFKELQSYLKKGKLAARSEALRDQVNKKAFAYKPVSLTELSAKFRKIHQYIWTKEKKSPSAAFEELMKIVFVKLKKDKELHASLGSDPEPKYEDVVFRVCPGTSCWIA